MLNMPVEGRMFCPCDQPSYKRQRKVNQSQCYYSRVTVPYSPCPYGSPGTEQQEEKLREIVI
jgi:hypothetical protein